MKNQSFSLVSTHLTKLSVGLYLNITFNSNIMLKMVK